MKLQFLEWKVARNLGYGTVTDVNGSHPDRRSVMMHRNTIEHRFPYVDSAIYEIVRENFLRNRALDMT